MTIEFINVSLEIDLRKGVEKNGENSKSIRGSNDSSNIDNVDMRAGLKEIKEEGKKECIT